MLRDIELSLYVKCMNKDSNRLLAKLIKFCDDQFRENYTLNLYDLSKDDSPSRINKVMATPTLVRERPKPARRITGDLTNIHKSMLALKLLPN